MFRSGFLEVPTKPVSTSEGEIRVPLLIADGSALLALFATDYDRAAVKLAGTGLTPLRLPANRAAALLFFTEYRDTAIGPYSEAASGIAAVPQGHSAAEVVLDPLRAISSRSLGLHLMDLPVTTTISAAAGCEVWGLPKYPCELPMSFEGRAFHGMVLDPETKQAVVSFEGTGSLVRGPIPAPSVMLYTQLQGSLRRTLLKTSGPMRWTAGRGYRLQVGTSSHRMAQNLRDLRLDGARPLLVVYTRRIRGQLHAPV